MIRFNLLSGMVSVLDRGGIARKPTSFGPPTGEFQTFDGGGSRGRPAVRLHGQSGSPGTVPRTGCPGEATIASTDVVRPPDPAEVRRRSRGRDRFPRIASLVVGSDWSACVHDIDEVEV